MGKWRFTDAYTVETTWALLAWIIGILLVIEITLIFIAVEL